KRRAFVSSRNTSSASAHTSAMRWIRSLSSGERRFSLRRRTNVLRGSTAYQTALSSGEIALKRRSKASVGNPFASALDQSRSEYPSGRPRSSLVSEWTLSIMILRRFQLRQVTTWHERVYHVV